MIRYLLFVLVVSLKVCGQQKIYGIDLGYGNFGSRAFDNTIRYYNFSQPFLKNKQPLLQHGFYGSLYYYGKGSGKFRPGGTFNFCYFPSLPVDKEFQFSILPKAFTLGLLAGFFPFDTLSRLSALSFDGALNFGVLSTGLRLDGEKFMTEEEVKYKSNTFTYNAELKINYRLVKTKSYAMGLFANVSFWPRVYIKELAENLNGSSVANLNDKGNMFMFGVGVRQNFN